MDINCLSDDYIYDNDSYIINKLKYNLMRRTVGLMTVSFFLLTIFLYIFGIQLRQICDKCYLCYIICHSTNLSINILSIEDKLLLTACYIVGKSLNICA